MVIASCRHHTLFRFPIPDTRAGPLDGNWSQFKLQKAECKAFECSTTAQRSDFAFMSRPFLATCLDTGCRKIVGTLRFGRCHAVCGNSVARWRWRSLRVDGSWAGCRCRALNRDRRSRRGTRDGSLVNPAFAHSSWRASGDGGEPGRPARHDVHPRRQGTGVDLTLAPPARTDRAGLSAGDVPGHRARRRQRGRVTGAACVAGARRTATHDARDRQLAMAGGVSLATWLTAIAAGRMIASW
jgi:hypothetical protein